MNRMKCIFLAMAVLLCAIIPEHTAGAQTSTIPGTPAGHFTRQHQARKKEGKIYFEKYAKNIFIGDSYTLRLANVPEDYQVTFKSSDDSILHVEQTSNTTCQVSGNEYGKANIVAKISDGGFWIFEKSTQVQAKFFVSPHAASIRFRKTKRKITLPNTIKLSTIIRPSISKEKPVFSTKNAKIATVSSKGYVTPRRTGKTTIIATLANGQTAKCKITVKKPCTNPE